MICLNRNNLPQLGRKSSLETPSPVSSSGALENFRPNLTVSTFHRQTSPEAPTRDFSEKTSMDKAQKSINTAISRKEM